MAKYRKKKINLTIDGHPLTVVEGTTVMAAASCWGFASPGSATIRI